MMKFGDKIVLTSYGALATDGTEYSIDDLKKLFCEEEFTVVNFSFDEGKKRFKLEYSNKAPEFTFSWNTCTVYIELSTFHKKLYDDGIIDPNLQKIFDLVEKVNNRKREKSICSQVLKTGDLPTDKEELKIYDNYLKKELSETKANIVKNSLALSFPLLWGMLSYVFFKTGFRHSEFNLAYLLEIIAGVSSGVCGVFFLGCIFDILEELKKEIENIKQIMSKKECVDKIKEGYDLVELAKAASVVELNGKEEEKASKYQNVFFQEVDAVKNSIVKLPDGEKEIYARLLADILKEYIDAVNSIFEKNDKQMNFGSASSVWEINLQMLPKVYRLGGMVDEALKNMEEENVSLDGYQELQKELETLSGNEGCMASYTDGWTDGYTDDLSAGGAYAVQKSY